MLMRPLAPLSSFIAIRLFTTTCPRWTTTISDEESPRYIFNLTKATAILAADAMQTMAYEVLASDDLLTAEARISLISSLASASGPRGMIAGQIIDMDAENQTVIRH